MDSGTQREIHAIVDEVVKTRMAELRELQVQDFADCITIFLMQFAKIIEDQDEARMKELLNETAEKAKDAALKHRPGFV